MVHALSPFEPGDRPPITLAQQTWRRQADALHNRHLNPPLEWINPEDHKPLLLFVHGGKCAGESIIRAIATRFGTLVHCLQFHSFDANDLLADVLRSNLRSLAPGRRVAFLIADRDPVTRWFSAFNWDLHDLFLSRRVPPPPGYRRYPSASALARGIAAADPEALSLGRNHHMGMGVAWYLPLSLIPLLHGQRVYRIRQEQASSDFRWFADDFSRFSKLRLRQSIGRLLQPKRQVGGPLPRSKHTFRQAYPAGTFSNPSACDAHTIARLRDYLSDDYRVRASLRPLCLGPGSGA